MLNKDDGKKNNQMTHTLLKTISCFFGVLFTLAVNCLSVQAASPAADAVAQIDGFHSHLLTLMKKGDSETFTDKEAFLTPHIEAAFDIDYMVRALVGRKWKKISDSDKQQLRSAFLALTAATYVSRFTKFSGEEFRSLGTAEGPKQSYWVNTKIVTSEGKDVLLNYLMHEESLADTGKKSRIIDIYLDGTISEFATRRSEYRSILKRSDVAGLVNILTQKVEKIRTK